MKKYLSILLFSFPFLLYAQNEQVDSLRQLINQEKNNTIKIDLLHDLGELYSEMNSDSLYPVSEELIALSEKEKDWCNKAVGVHYKANYFYHNGELDEALIQYQESLIIREKYCSKEKVASSHVMIGNVNQMMGNYDIAYESYLKALEIYESIEDDNSISYVYSNLGLLDVSREDYDAAEEKYKKALDFENSSVEPDSVNLGNIYNNIGGLYEAQEMYDTAVVYFEKAMLIYKLAEHKSGLSHGYNNLGIIKYYQGYPDSCMVYFHRSLDIRKELGKKADISQSYNNIGILHMYEGNFDYAIKYADTALSIALEGKMTEEISDAYLSKYETYLAMENYRDAVQNLKLYTDYKDTLSSEQSEKTINVLQNKYEAVKKEQEIQEKNADLAEKNASIKRKNIIIWSAILVTILLVSLSIVVYNRNQVTKRQNKIIQEQKLVVEEKQTEIIDSIEYAKRIQDALLKSENHESGHLPEHFILFKPRDIVSGDFYWVHEKDEYLYLAVADCTGHGVPGAFLTMLGSAFLNEIIINNDQISPAKILDELRNKIVRELSQTGVWGDNADGMDVSIVQLNLKTLELNWAGANNPLWIVREESDQFPQPSEQINVYENLIEIKPDKQPVGFYWVMNPFTEHKIQLAKGDVFYLFSDGYADQFGGEKGKKFKYKPLKDAIIAFAGSEMELRKQKLNEILENWKGDYEQIDDICIMGVRV